MLGSENEISSGPMIYRLYEWSAKAISFNFKLELFTEFLHFSGQYLHFSVLNRYRATLFK